MLILDGKKPRAAYKKTLLEKMKGLAVTPHLAIIQVGARTDSDAYIGAKKKFAAEIGVHETHVALPAAATQAEIIAAVEHANTDPAVHGIIVQLPLPLSIDTDAVINAIDPAKDIDGLTAANVKKWLEGRADAIWPATTRGVRELLDFYGITLEGKKVAMLGQSNLVGKPTAALCLAEGAVVTVCHSGTQNTTEVTRAADIIIVAIGKPKLIGPEYITTGQVVIDIGITSVGGKLTGDVDYDAVAPLLGPNGAITPVPGGVGQMTVLALFENLIDACYNKRE